MVAVALFCAAVPASLPAPVAAAPACAQATQGKVGVWTTRPAPTFPAGDRVLRGHAVDPREPLRQYATNGVSVVTTTDGCTWTEAFRLPERPSPGLPASSLTDRVLQVVVHPRAPGRVWLVVAVGQDVAERVRVGPYRPGLPMSPAGDEQRDGTQTLVLASKDAGASWTGMTGPLLVGTPGTLATAPSSPEVLYLPTSSGLHASLDGGRTWQPRPPAATAPDPKPGRPPLDAVTTPDTARVTVDPTSAATLYGHNPTAVRRSEDGGLTWSAYPLPPDYTSGPFVDRTLSSTRRMVVATQQNSTEPVRSLWFLQPDGTLDETPVEPGGIAGVPWRAVWHPTRDELVMATWDRGNGAAFPEVSLYRLDSHGAVEDINELDLSPLGGLDVDDYGTYHLHTASEILTLGTASRTQDLEQGPPQVEMDPFAYTPPPPPPPAGLSGPAVVDLVPGEPAQVTWTLDLPRRPSPLDTYFLIDTSNSFEPDIQALADGMGDVVRTLTRNGIDTHFGIGELGTREARRYSQLADLGPPGTHLQRGFERLRTGGGYESHLIALHQAATGSGVEGTSGPAVPAGQDPTWRGESLRTLVVVTDVEYVDEEDPEAPTRRRVYDALAARGVRVIGLEVVREGGDDGVPGGYAAVEAADAASTTAPTPARRDLEELAAATGSFAPPGGVDCRDNGTTEIPAGAPMVCTTTALHVARISTLADVLTRVLLAQVDQRPVALRPSGDVSVAPVSPGGLRHPAVDLKRDQELTFTAALRCDVDQAGRRLPLSVDALVAGQQVASATTTVRCGPAGPAAPPAPDSQSVGEPPPSEPEPLPGGQPPSSPQSAIAVPAAPPAAPAPIGGTAPAPGTAPGTAPGSASAPAAAAEPGIASATGGQSASAGSPAGAVSPAREDSPELAHASLQTSARSAEPPTVQPWTMLVAGLLAGATATTRMRRTRQHRPTPTARSWTR